jgi:hypothetical protein
MIQHYVIKFVIDLRQVGGFLRVLNINFNVVKNSQILVGFRFMVFNATFNNISVISWRSVLLVEETGVLGENHQPAASQ